MSTETKAKSKKPKVKAAEQKFPVPLPPDTGAALSNAQVAFALSISIRKLQAMISAGEFPRQDFPIGDSPRWRVATLNAWIEKQVEKAKGHN